VLKSVDGRSGSFSKHFYIVTTFKLTTRVNYNVPIKVTMYHYKCTVDSTLDVIARYKEGLSDKGVDVVTSPSLFNSVNLYPYDSDILKRFWKLEKAKTRILQPGETMVMAGNAVCNYDPSIVDVHSFDYQRKFQCQIILLRVEGVLGHNNGGSRYGAVEAGVDYQYDSSTTTHYDGGAKFDRLIASTNSLLNESGRTGVEQSGINQVFSVS
jgi:hypothetical protein